MSKYQPWYFAFNFIKMQTKTIKIKLTEHKINLLTIFP